MTAVARKLPEPVDLALQRTLAAVDAAERERFVARMRNLIDETRELRAVAESNEEHKLFANWYRFALDSHQLVRAALPETYTWFSEEQLHHYLRAQASGSRAQRRFLIRQLEQAATTFTAMVQLAAADFGDDPPKVDEIEVVALELGFWRPPAESLIPTRFHLDVLVALDTVEGPWNDDELLYWVRRARLGASRASEVTRQAIRQAFSDAEPPGIVQWFEGLMADPAQRKRIDRVVALGLRSNGDATVEQQLAAETTDR